MEKAAYDSLVVLAKQIYEISDDGTERSYTQSVFGDINEAIVAAGFPFSPLHVEPLLDQAQELLSRALQDRKIYSEAAAQAFQISLELEEFAKLDEIHERERQAGAYTVERDRAECDFHVENINKSTAKSVLFWTKGAHDTAYANTPNEVPLRAIYAYANAGDNIAEGHMPRTDYHLDAGTLKFSGYKPDVVEAIAQQLADWDVNNRNETLSAQLAQAEGVAAAGEFREKSADINHNFLLRTVETKEARLNVTREMNAKKMRAVTIEDGPLNYVGISKMARRRYISNLVKAYQRVVPAAEGMQVIYGYKEQAPDYKEFGYVGADISDSFLDRCWLWTQTATNYLAYLQRREQNTVLHISVLRLIGASEFQQALDAGVWEFDVPKSKFPGSALVRLRGLGISLSGLKDKKALSLWIQPPKEPSYDREDGDIGKFDGRQPPMIRHGRVQEWNANRDTDVVGVVSLHNWSPIGKWRIGIDEKAKVEDIYLDLHLAMLISS